MRNTSTIGVDLVTNQEIDREHLSIFYKITFSSVSVQRKRNAVAAISARKIRNKNAVKMYCKNNNYNHTHTHKCISFVDDIKLLIIVIAIIIYVATIDHKLLM